MPFHSDIRQFSTIAAFAAYLSTLPPPAWHPIGTTAHNTYRPLASQWVGKPSMLSMITTYKAKEWDRGPHLYFVVGAPNKAHDGIWLMTPLSMYGIHAGACNSERFGCELVGDFQDVAPSAALQTLFVDATAALHRWAGIGPDLNAHRDCMPGRTCPGDAMYALMPQLRTRLAAKLAPPPPDYEALWGPIASPDAITWAWSIPALWKTHHARLGRCIAPALYGNDGVVVQLFEGGDVRGRLVNDAQVYEVCFR